MKIVYEKEKFLVNLYIINFRRFHLILIFYEFLVFLNILKQANSFVVL